MPIVTLPFVELVDRFGPVPDGVELDVWDVEGPYDRPGDVAITLLPFYFAGRHRWQYVHDLPNLRLLQLPSAGYEHALPHAPAHAQVANGRGIHDDETAELAVGLALTSLREIHTFQTDRAAGVWDARTTRSLADRRVTVVGYGAIGAAIATRFEAMRCDVTVVARTRGSRTVDTCTPSGTSRHSRPGRTCSCSSRRSPTRPSTSSTPICSLRCPTAPSW